MEYCSGCRYFGNSSRTWVEGYVGICRDEKGGLIYLTDTTRHRVVLKREQKSEGLTTIKDGDTKTLRGEVTLPRSHNK